MTELAPHEPYRPLVWPDVVYDLQDMVADAPQPVYIVGGAVRDALLHRPVTDIDLAAASGGIALARRLANALRGDFFVLDAERDVGRTLVDTPQGRLIIDVARFRGEDLLADLSDRDFTINAMAVDLTGDVRLLIDPLGGEQDVRAGLVRQCSPAALTHDPLRALRAVRQSVQLGMHIEAQTLRDVRAAGASLAEISAERLRDEFIKLLTVSKPRTALRVAEALGLLNEVLPEAADLKNQEARSSDYADGWQETLGIIEKLNHLLLAISPRRTDHTGATFGVGMLVMQFDRYRRQLQTHLDQRWPNDRPHAALLVLAAVLRKSGTEQASARAQALRLSNTERDRLVSIVRHFEQPLQVDVQSPLELHRFWRQTGEAGVDLCLLAAAGYLGIAASELNQDSWLGVVEHLLLLLHTYYERYDELVAPPVLVDGNQLMAQLDLARGPLVGMLLDRIREAQVTGEVRSSDEALNLARAALREHHSR